MTVRIDDKQVHCLCQDTNHDSVGLNPAAAGAGEDDGFRASEEKDSVLDELPCRCGMIRGEEDEAGWSGWPPSSGRLPRAFSEAGEIEVGFSSLPS